MEKTLVIKGKLASLNEYTKACRSNAYAGANMKKQAEKYIQVFIMQQLKGVHFDGTVELAFRWYEPNKKRDLDNICFSKKFVLDALVTNKIINQFQDEHSTTLVAALCLQEGITA